MTQGPNPHPQDSAPNERPPRDMPQRLAEDRIAPRGPARPDADTKKRRVIWGLSLTLLLFALLVVAVLLNDPIR